MKINTKRIISIFICIVMTLSLIACSEESNDNDGIKVYFCANSQNVLREEEYSGGEEFVLNTFRGDVESGQIIVTPDKDVAKFDFVAHDLTRVGGSEKISADLIDVFAERYIEVTQPTSPYSEVGWYPDALVPMKNYAARRDNKIAKGENQGIWINVNVPKDTMPGTYKGNGTLALDDENIDVPMTVNIYNIDMPEINHVKTGFYIDSKYLLSVEKKSAEEFGEIYYEFALSKRISPLTVPEFSDVGIDYDAQEYAETIVKYAKDNRVGAYQLPYIGDGDGLVDQSYCEEILTALAEKNVELIESGENVDLFEKAYYYLGSLIDEPIPQEYYKVRECDLRIHKAKLKVADSEILEDYPELQESVLKVNHIVTSKIVKDLYGTDDIGGVQTWCPTIDNFLSENSRALALERMNSTDRRGGEGVWWYTCCFPLNPNPTLHLDDTVMSPRTTAWMQYDYKIQGRIYWSMNFWAKQSNQQIVPGFDVWKDALNFENCNGDGILMYPGSKYGVKGPIATLRLEALRESYEDYEILMLLDNEIQSIAESNGKNYDSDKILGKFYDRLYNGIIRNDDLTAEKFESVRKELLELVEKVVNNESGAISLLDEYNS